MNCKPQFHLLIGIGLNGTNQPFLFSFQRVTRFNNAPSKPNGANADAVIGQPAFGTNSAGSGATGMNLPIGVGIDESTNRIFVSDTNNHV